MVPHVGSEVEALGTVEAGAAVVATNGVEGPLQDGHPAAVAPAVHRRQQAPAALLVSQSHHTNISLKEHLREPSNFILTDVWFILATHYPRKLQESSDTSFCRSCKPSTLQCTIFFKSSSVISHTPHERL